MERLNWGLAIKRARKYRKCSQIALGAFLGVTRQTIMSWEKNETTPDVEALERICKHLRYSVNELVLMAKETGE